MRGVRVSKASQRDYDLVVIAARYRDEGQTLDMVQAIQRRGPIWGDVVLLSRSQLLAALKSGERVVAGRHAEIQGDFEVTGEVHALGENGSEKLVVGERKPTQDDLLVPLF